jgi:hypothetical protein
MDRVIKLLETTGAVEKVFVKGFKFLSLGIYLTYLTYNVLSLSFLIFFQQPGPFLRAASPFYIFYQNRIFTLIKNHSQN